MTTGDGRASLSGPLGSPYGKTLFISGFGPDPSDGVGIESDLGEQFIVGGDVEFEVTVEHGLVSCSGWAFPASEIGRPPPSPMPGVRPALAFLWLEGWRRDPGAQRTRRAAGSRSGLREVRDPGQVRRMDDRGLIKRRGFWLLALLWLPAAVRFAPEAGPGMWLSMALMWAGSLVPVAIAVYAAVLSLPVWDACGGSSGGVEAGGRRVGCAARRTAQCTVSLSGSRGTWATVPPAIRIPDGSGSAIRMATGRRHVQAHVPGRHRAGSGSPYASPPSNAYD